jgi:hypothetical protein
MPIGNHLRARLRIPAATETIARYVNALILRTRNDDDFWSAVTCHRFCRLRPVAADELLTVKQERGDRSPRNQKR